ncbi:hypothetical protein D3C87_1716820 [compost metagenome]
MIEVFVIDAGENLEPLHAFQYPPPLAALFPADYGILNEGEEDPAALTKMVPRADSER